MPELMCWNCGRSSGIEASDDDREALCAECHYNEYSGMIEDAGTSAPDPVWSDLYTTQVLDVGAPWGWSQHLIIQRRDGEPISAEWDVLQAIKDDVLGADVFAVEVYPAQNALVNEVNRRHLWSIPKEVLGIGLHRP